MAYSYPIWNNVEACIKRALFDKKNKTFNFLDREPMTTNQEPNPKQLELF
jgi:hypothetical protein